MRGRGERARARGEQRGAERLRGERAAAAKRAEKARSRRAAGGQAYARGLVHGGHAGAVEAAGVPLDVGLQGYRAHGGPEVEQPRGPHAQPVTQVLGVSQRRGEAHEADLRARRGEGAGGEGCQRQRFRRSGFPRALPRLLPYPIFALPSLRNPHPNLSSYDHQSPSSSTVPLALPPPKQNPKHGANKTKSGAPRAWLPVRAAM